MGDLDGLFIHQEARNYCRYEAGSVERYLMIISTVPWKLVLRKNSAGEEGAQN